MEQPERRSSSPCMTAWSRVPSADLHWTTTGTGNKPFSHLTTEICGCLMGKLDDPFWYILLLWGLFLELCLDLYGRDCFFPPPTLPGLPSLFPIEIGQSVNSHADASKVPKVVWEARDWLGESANSLTFASCLWLLLANKSYNFVQAQFPTCEMGMYEWEGLLGGFDEIMYVKALLQTVKRDMPVGGYQGSRVMFEHSWDVFTPTVLSPFLCIHLPLMLGPQVYQVAWVEIFLG